MLGPIWYQATLRGTRRHWLLLLRYGYGLWLLVLFYFLCSPGLATHEKEDPTKPHLSATAIWKRAEEHWFVGSQTFVRAWLWQQYLLLFLVSVPFVAGDITDEKSRGTLQHLFTTPFWSGHIILGKLLGRGLQLLAILLAGVPLYCFAAAWLSFRPTYILAQLAVLVLWVYALSAAALLASVWSRNTRTAILGLYAVVLLTVVVLVTLRQELDNLTRPEMPPAVADAARRTLTVVDPWLDALWPTALLPTYWSEVERLEVPALFPRVALLYGGLGTLFLLLAVWRLRPAYAKQLEQAGRGGDAWYLRRHPPVTERPVCWKEQYTAGLAPPLLRRLPRWVELTLLALLGVGVGVWFGTGAGVGSVGWQIGRELVYTFALVVVAVFVVGVRSSGLITVEHERGTWEALRLTPLTVTEILRQKFQGVHRAGLVWLVAYGTPALLLAATTGVTEVAWMVTRLLQAWITVRWAAALGVYYSSRSRSSWRALLGTMMLGMLMALLLCLLGGGLIAGALARLHEPWQYQMWHDWPAMAAMVGLGLGVTALLEWGSQYYLNMALRWLGVEDGA